MNDSYQYNTQLVAKKKNNTSSMMTPMDHLVQKERSIDSNLVNLECQGDKVIQSSRYHHEPNPSTYRQDQSTSIQKGENRIQQTLLSEGVSPEDSLA